MKLFRADVKEFGGAYVLSRNSSPIELINDAKDCLIGYSTRNNRFTKAWFRYVIDWAAKNNKNLIVQIVDLPYAYNDAAFESSEIPNEKTFEKCKKIGDERERMLLKLKGEKKKINIFRWSQLQGNREIRRFGVECDEAFRNSERFYKTIVGYVNEWRGDKEFADINLASEFLLQEIPLFAWWYYVRNILIDIYPGSMFPIFWEIEQGLWKDDLPILSAAAEGKHMTFISVT